MSNSIAMPKIDVCTSIVIIMKGGGPRRGMKTPFLLCLRLCRALSCRGRGRAESLLN
jgi:hypothetical protein